jgi:hypothetical protein
VRLEPTALRQTQFFGWAALGFLSLENEAAQASPLQALYTVYPRSISEVGEIIMISDEPLPFAFPTIISSRRIPRIDSRVKHKEAIIVFMSVSDQVPVLEQPFVHV